MFGAKDHSVTSSLTRMNMLVSITALLTACLAFIAYDTAAFRETIITNLSSQAQIAASNSISALMFNDPAAAEKTLSALQAQPSIISAAIYTPDGQLFAAYSRNPSNPLPPLPASPNSRSEVHYFDRKSILVARPIVFQDKIVGAICLQSNMNRLFVRFERYIGIVALVMMASLLAARLVSSISRRSIAGPIVHLADVANTFSTGKNNSIRASAAGAQAEIGVLIRAFNEMLDQIQQRDAALQEARENLERRVEERTAELTVANRELEAFSYSVSHDLRAPLRSINGFTQALLDDCADNLDQNGIQYLERVRGATQRMGVLIDDLLNLSRVTRADLHRQKFDIGDLARSVANDLQRTQPNREIDLHIEAGHEVVADPGLLRLVLENLFSNAWKFTSKNASARIEFGQLRQNGESPFFVRDDGAGFDPEHTSQLFGPFQRLHAMNEFPGTGVGLATVQRIVNRHGGRIWAHGAVGRGATFYFTLA